MRDWGLRACGRKDWSRNWVRFGTFQQFLLPDLTMISVTSGHPLLRVPKQPSSTVDSLRTWCVI